MITHPQGRTTPCEPWRESIQRWSVQLFTSLLCKLPSLQFFWDFFSRCRADHNEIGGGRLTERASSCVGGSRGLDKVERRLRAEAANIPLSGIGLVEDWGIKGKRKQERTSCRSWSGESPNKSWFDRLKCLGCTGCPKEHRQGGVSSGCVWSRSVTVGCVGPVRADAVGQVLSEENDGLRKYRYQADVVGLSR